MLPKRYCESMKELLGEEYSDYIDSFSQSSHTAFRVNTGKISLEEWEAINPFETEKVFWTEKGYYYDAKKTVPAKHPYYYAGLYYIQEASAMIPASILPIEAGDKVLDLCAAPGGKATELGAKLGQTGVLIANDISVSRAAILAKNLQFAGITNAIVTAETPQRLWEHFGQFFDKILIDAPCSGEGMFRREPRMIKDWEEKGPEYYAPIQKEILQNAYEMLKPGGMMVYSTCTFSPKEDEETVQWLLDTYPDMQICEVQQKEGFSQGRPNWIDNGSESLKKCIRIFPHRAKGEGHFAVLMQKKDMAKTDSREVVEAEKSSVTDSKEVVKTEKSSVTDSKISIETEKNSKKKNGKKGRGGKNAKNVCGGKGQEDVKNMSEEVLAHLPLKEWDESRKITDEKGKIIWEPPVAADRALRTLYRGLPVCEYRHKISMAPQMALALTKKEYAQVLDLSAADDRVIRYLKGETIQSDEPFKGNVLICVDGYGLGWCQGNGQGMLKNKYYPGWRYQ